MNINNEIVQGGEGNKKSPEFDGDIKLNTSFEVFNLLSNSKEKYIFLSGKLTNIFNTRYLLALRNDVIEFYKGVLDNTKKLGIELFNKDEIDEEEWLIQQSLKYRFIVDVFREKGIAKINIGIKSYLQEEDDLLEALDFEKIKYFGKNEEQNHSYYLDNYMTRLDWNSLAMEIFTEHGILIVDSEKLWKN